MKCQEFTERWYLSWREMTTLVMPGKKDLEKAAKGVSIQKRILNY